MKIDEIIQLSIPESSAPRRAVPVSQMFGAGGCDIDKNGLRAIGVPFGDRAHDRVIRLHELLHARHTPAFPKRSKISPIALNAAEDMLVHGRFWRPRAYGEQMDRDVIAVALRDARAVQTFPMLAMQCNVDLLVWLRCYAILLAYEDDMRYYVPFAKPLQRLYKLLQASPHSARLQAMGFHRRAKLDRLHLGKAATARARLRRVISSVLFTDGGLGSDPDSGKGRKRQGRGDSPYASRTMEIVEPPRPYPCRANMKRQYVPARSGALIRAGRIVHALTTGNMAGAFLRHKRAPGGAIVIDASGSMGLSDEKLQELCSRLPAALVAYYSDYTKHGCRCSTGSLVVYARGGKRIREIVSRGGGNGCDLQAIEWLVKQNGPRVFVSDGGFCGGNAGDSERATSLLTRKVRAKRMTWVTTTNVDAIVAAVHDAL